MAIVRSAELRSPMVGRGTHQMVPGSPLRDVAPSGECCATETRTTVMAIVTRFVDQSIVLLAVKLVSSRGVQIVPDSSNLYQKPSHDGNNKSRLAAVEL